ncbi:MAG: hypothetical protein PUC05_04760 [Firmicutes bacterium]|nr:hypothetical protein [Bacillota bacterium]
MDNRITDGDIPQGLAMELMQNREAAERFRRMAPEQRSAVVRRASEIRSRAEMQAFVESLID